MRGLQRAGRRSNLALLGLLLVAGGTGVLGFAVGTPVAGRVVAVAHGAAGLGLLLLVPWKTVVVRRARARPPQLRAPAAAYWLTGLVAVCVVSGVLHAAGAAGIWATSGTLIAALQVHVGAAVVLVVALVAHIWGRHQRPRKVDLSRRTLLGTGALAGGSLALWAVTEGVWRVTGAPGARRSGTGSYERGTDDPAAMPVTQWASDTVPDAVGSSITLSGGGREVVVPLADLDRGDEVRARLDCTGGWYADQDWRGTTLARLVADHLGEVAGAQCLLVTSVTGFSRRIPLRDAEGTLLATHAAGQPLSPGHGAPVRLVAPGRRGVWWVKWVDRVEVLDSPWWLQPPFPLQ
ncbi:molybdopterin-dependent oxidoreductase [Klenkia sp. PcliD-1-E]|uniref:molybdopterin-dependent oxidoreductase n=1 Tax=Klenkia sp. PcliD-1-E TaxID=2954492 RepID=UPI0020973F9E|nr:molybdopterin-dependent oxidoreductase [Klenkia sp. PcliD-1-E]MCO7218741.1 molybdopterin-dependent oxidoreductase [Klenkia sp. PcliD-1-E]